MKVFSVSVLSLLLLGSALAQSPKVLLLPVQNTTGEKWEELRTKLNERVSNQLQKAFGERGFTTLSGEPVQKAIEDEKIDFTDEENHRKDLMYRVGDRLQADYVVFVVITHNGQKTRENLFSTVKEGEVTIKYWLLDAKKREAIASAKSETAKARPAAFGKGSDQQLTAADRVVVAAFRPFLEKFPVKG